jgi:glycosyltransferase involved in cell wall biosynthesis
MLEAMASGLPVAAFPVEGPLEVIGDSPAGAMSNDLREAWSQALRVRRHQARRRAQDFGWAAVAELFLSHLVRLPAQHRTVLSHKRHRLVE